MDDCSIVALYLRRNETAIRQTAEKYGIKAGDFVCIENPLGKCVERARISNEVPERVIHATHGWWYPEEDGEFPNLFGTWKSNVNKLIPMYKVGKLGYGAPFKNSLCSVTPLAENLDLDLKDFAERFGKLVY